MDWLVDFFSSLSRIIKVKPNDLIPRQNLKNLTWSGQQKAMGPYRPRKYGYITVDKDGVIMDGHHRYQRILEKVATIDNQSFYVRQIKMTYQTYLKIVWLSIFSIIVTCLLLQVLLG